MGTQYRVDGSGVVVETTPVAPSKPASSYVVTPARAAATQRLVDARKRENDERRAVIQAKIADAMQRAGNQNQPEIRQIRAGDLFVDRENYQRALDDEEVLAIACDYNQYQFGELLVNERPNKVLAVIDGQHRFKTMIQLL